MQAMTMEWWLQDGEGTTTFVSGLFAGRATVVEAKLSGDGLHPRKKNIEPSSGKFVYSVLTKDLISRVNGKSQVLYIGQGNASRMSALLNNVHSASRALRQIGEIRDREVSVVWRAIKDDAKHLSTDSCLVEAFLLHDVAAKHGELPPANLRWEGFFVGELLKAMIKHVHSGGEPRGLRSYDWPADLQNRRPKHEVTRKDESTWCEHGNLSLGWLWPEGWTKEVEYKIGGRTVKSGQLVLASRKERNAPWLLDAAGSIPLPGLGTVNDAALAVDWEAVDKASARSEHTPKERLRAWLADIIHVR